MIYRLIKKMDAKRQLGKRFIIFLITDERRRKLRKKMRTYLLDKKRTRRIRQASAAKETHLEEILQVCLQHIAPVTAPLALVSQISYSGGSLLRSLFDGHSNLHAYPHEFAIDALNKNFWPQIDIEGNPEKSLVKIFKSIDFVNFQKVLDQGKEDQARFSLMHLPVLQKEIFKKYLDSAASLTMRLLFDAYMTACFGAWLNYQNHRIDKKFVTAYAPGLTMHNGVIDNFFEIYPDGKLISIVMNPEHWFVAASRVEPERYGDIEFALNHWKESVQAAIQSRQKFGDRVCLVNFEDIVTQTESVMRYLSEFLKIPYEDVLLKRTFNGLDLQSETGQKTHDDTVSKIHVIEAEKLDGEQLRLIKEITGADYQTALREVVIL
jgi:hypothetical protein